MAIREAHHNFVVVLCHLSAYMLLCLAAAWNTAIAAPPDS